MILKVKKLRPHATLPSYAKKGDAGLDLVATTVAGFEDGTRIYGTDIAIEIPEGYVGLLFKRSSVHKKDLRLANAVGVIDSKN